LQKSCNKHLRSLNVACIVYSAMNQYVLLCACARARVRVDLRNSEYLFVNNFRRKIADLNGVCVYDYLLDELF
jgi:hypothetical protein